LYTNGASVTATAAAATPAAAASAPSPAEHGNEGESQGHRQPKDSGVKKLYKLTKHTSVEVRKFRTTGVEYTAIVQPLENVDNFIVTLYNILESLLQELTQGLDPWDRIRLQMQTHHLDYPISLPFLEKGKLSVQHILEAIERVLQSNEEFSFDEPFTINVTIVRLPNVSGSGWMERSARLVGKKVNEKKSIITIRNHDSLCACRAIGTGIAKLLADIEQEQIREDLGSGPPNWVATDDLLSMAWGKFLPARKGYNIQKKLAHKIIQLSGVGYEKLNIEDLKDRKSVV
jgi:hypothetical protein